jgi:PleD family two-component response regulator
MSNGKEIFDDMEGSFLEDAKNSYLPQVTSRTGGAVHKAFVLVKEPAAAAALVQELEKASFIVNASSDSSLSLDECRRNTPDLVVVEENLATMSGIRFIADLLRVSWTTATILVSERDDEAIHEATEGLGILGHIKGYEDLEGLGRLLTRFEEMLSPAQFGAHK